MIDLYYYTSPNARKVLMALEELGLAYRVQWVDITAGEQHGEAYAHINPNGKIPALVDHDGPGGRPLVLFESGAILLYLAEKTGRLIPADPASRLRVIKWLFWQTSSQGPMLGQAAHFVSHAAQRGIESDYAVARYSNEALRLYGVLEHELATQDFLCGEFSIADIAAYPWVRVAKGQGVRIADFPRIERWCTVIGARASAQKKLERDAATLAAAKTGYYSDATWQSLFGNQAGRAPASL
jgi:GSH-dependent disulfide-bond oxidoreductase